MAFILEENKEDESKLSQGVWQEYDIDVRLKVASANSPEYRKALKNVVAKKMPKNRKLWTEEKLIEVQMPIIAEHILKDWEGIFTRAKDGTLKAVKYKPETGLVYLQESRSLRDFVVDRMTADENYLVEAVDDAVKN